MKVNYKPLCELLHYQFKRVDYLITALTHRSASPHNNERLEFLGDALLSFIIAQALFEKFPKASEGELTRLRAKLVRRETLAEVAQILHLDKFIQLGSGELKSGAWRRSSILADAVEAIIGAIYSDAGLEECRAIVLALWQPYLANLSPNMVAFKDPKTRLQEYLQARQLALPVYRVVDIQGSPQAQEFCVECSVPILEKTIQGTGKSRRYAEQMAAERILEILQQSVKR